MSPRVVVSWVVRLLTVAALGVDAGIHADLAPSQPPSKGISQIDLFWFETAVAILAAVLVLILASRLAYAFAFVVAATALGAVVLSRYVDLGAVGPLPDLYEPFWYASKVATTIAEAVAVVVAAVGFALHRADHRRPARRRARERAASPASP